jgi:hypothetical protein
MFTLDLDNFMMELKDGSVKHAGPSNTSATVKLYDVDGIDVREFGDERIKLAFSDDEGNEVEVALFPEEAREVLTGIELLEEDSRVFE